jgi:hypothetical protein
MEGMERFQKKLKEQLGFLERSCQMYDEGHIDEAIRIAATLRTLIHDTGRSTSLLKHMNATGIRLWSTTHRAPKGVGTYYGMGQYRYRDGVSSYGPSFDNTPDMKLIPLNEWWQQEVYVFDVGEDAKTDEEREEGLRLSRKNIVLTATNKDGGAHVDENLTRAYERLAADGAVGSFGVEIGGESRVVPIKYAHLVSLRQMGFEVLKSLAPEKSRPKDPGHSSMAEDSKAREEGHMGEAGSPIEHVLQEFEPLGGDPPQATLFMRCGTLSGPGPEGWRELNVEVTPIDTEIGDYSFTCPYCQGTIVYDPQQLGPPQSR